MVVKLQTLVTVIPLLAAFAFSSKHSIRDANASVHLASTLDPLAYAATRDQALLGRGQKIGSALPTASDVATLSAEANAALQALKDTTAESGSKVDVQFKPVRVPVGVGVKEALATPVVAPKAIKQGTIPANHQLSLPPQYLNALKKLRSDVGVISAETFTSNAAPHTSSNIPEHRHSSLPPLLPSSRKPQHTVTRATTAGLNPKGTTGRAAARKSDLTLKSTKHALKVPVAMPRGATAAMKTKHAVDTPTSPAAANSAHKAAKAQRVAQSQVPKPTRPRTDLDRVAKEDATHALEDAMKDVDAAEAALLKDVNWKVAGRVAAGTELHSSRSVRGSVLHKNMASESDSSGLVLPDLVKGDQLATELEKDVTNLVVGFSTAGFGATPMGSSIKTIQNLLEKNMMPKICHAHKLNQDELNKLVKDMHECDRTRKSQTKSALKSKMKYTSFSPKHKTCRSGEAGLKTELKSCRGSLRDKNMIKRLKCKEFAMVKKKYSTQQANKQIVKKSGGEAAETYVKRITATVCGGSWNGKSISGCGMQCKFTKAKALCQKASLEFLAESKKCKKLEKQAADKQSQCDSLQDQMDLSACKFAVDTKDLCEGYSECYASKRQTYLATMKMVKKEEMDRRAEWRGLKRMHCLVKAFGDGKVSNVEIKACKSKAYDTNHLVIKYPKLPNLQSCQVPNKYPSTAAYVKAEFSGLPLMAKGKSGANECTGVQEVSTKPKAGSPSSCKCVRVTMNGPFSPGALVKCTNCLDVRRTTDKSSCPIGTKIFSPRSRRDWESFLKSARPLRAPNWIMDVTRPHNGCGGCTRGAMNSRNKLQRTWVTVDGSPWWMRSTLYNEPNGDYHANCYLDLWQNPKTADHVTLNDRSCTYHSKSYYCQPEFLSMKPKTGSPVGCSCEKVELTSRYSAEILLQCKHCLDVRRSTQKNSCPLGTKLFAPASRQDWKAFIASAQPLRSPNWIIDITRPQNGCGGCTKFPMNSGTRPQATWRTSDRAKWWLRNTRYNEPNGDYTANCYMDLWKTPANENSVTFNDGRCKYHSNSYYCQKAKRR